jgi:small neutral amino acid transporter SnatA (MarC family)
VVPAAIPLVIAAGFMTYFALGGEANPHGAGGLFLMLMLSTSAIAAMVECILVPLSIIRLVNNPPLRTAANL